MKMTNLALAALVACGLAACGKETPMPTPTPTPKTGAAPLSPEAPSAPARTEEPKK